MKLTHYVLWAFLGCLGASSNLNGEARVIKDLLENYSVDARPVLNDSSAVNVRIDLELNQVIDIVSSNLSIVTSTQE